MYFLAPKKSNGNTIRTKITRVLPQRYNTIGVLFETDRVVGVARAASASATTTTTKMPKTRVTSPIVCVEEGLENCPGGRHPGSRCRFVPRSPTQLNSDFATLSQYECWRARARTAVAVRGIYGREKIYEGERKKKNYHENVKTTAGRYCERTVKSWARNDE